MTALADLPPLCDEIDRLDAAICGDAAPGPDAAARATLAADAEGEADPLYYLRDELEAAAAPDRGRSDGDSAADSRCAGMRGRCAVTASSP